jgi:peptide/nickel transport system permease protein
VARFVVQRLLFLPIVLFFISVTVFLSIRFAPGDPAEITTQQYATKAQLQLLREEWGISRPLWLQYFIFVRNASHGDLGRSFFGNVRVADQVAQRFPATIELAIASIAVSALLGIGAGTIAAVRRGAWVDHLSRILALFGISMPIFWLGLMLIALFSVKLGWLPVSGRIDARTMIESGGRFLIVDSVLRRDWKGFDSAVRHLILPAITMGMYSAGIVARFARSAMLEVLAQDYVRTAKAKGLPKAIVIYRHALRNAMLPVITILGLQFGAFLGGAAVTETVFAWPGLGKLLIDSINLRDYPQVQASVLILAVTYVLVNSVVDLLYSYIDPRIRYS